MVAKENRRYLDAVDKLLSLADFERKSRANQPPDWHLRRVEQLMEMLVDPHLATPLVHVAGSKGKGSTCAMISAGMSAAGLRTGLYTSPHLHTFTERIQIDGENISQDHFANLIERLWPYVEEIEHRGNLGVVSVFEMLTAMAFVHFRDNADFAVIETGLGGRLDATNVVDPLVAVITSISRDHVRILGDKISQIAYEKAGIIKPTRPVVVARNHAVTWRVIRDRAAELGSEVVSACATSPVSSAKPKFTEDLRQEFILKRWRPPRSLRSSDASADVQALQRYPDPGLGDVPIRTALIGAHQIDNARTASTALNLLYRSGMQFDLNAAVAGIANAVWPCRNEIIERDGWPPIILDGAHNDASLKALRNTILGTQASDVADSQSLVKSGTPYVLILGGTDGHELATAMKLLAKPAFSTIVTQSRHPKSIPASQLADEAKRHGIDALMRPSVDAALEDAAEMAREKPEIGLIIVTGSLFVAAEAREHLLRIEPEIYEDLKQPYMTPFEDRDTSEG